MAIVANGMPPTQSLPSALNGQPQAAIYARVSTTDQADRGFSLPTQVEACCSWAQEQSYSVPESYIFSEDYTGMSLHRPELGKLRELAQQHLIQAVLVYDQDRLSRKLAHQLLLSEEFEDAGVPVYVLSMPMTEKTPRTPEYAASSIQRGYAIEGGPAG